MNAGRFGRAGLAALALCLATTGLSGCGPRAGAESAGATSITAGRDLAGPGDGTAETVSAAFRPPTVPLSELWRLRFRPHEIPPEFHWPTPEVRPVPRFRTPEEFRNELKAMVELWEWTPEDRAFGVAVACSVYDRKLTDEELLDLIMEAFHVSLPFAVDVKDLAEKMQKDVDEGHDGQAAVRAACFGVKTWFSPPGA